MNRETTEHGRLIEENMGLVVKMVQQFKPKTQEDFDAYTSEGKIALWNAIKKFDPNKGKLSTIACNYIKWAIIRYINKKRVITPIDGQEIYDYSYDTDHLWEILPDNLSKLEKQTIELKFEGNSFKEIGSRLGEKPTTISKIFRKGIEKVKKANQI